MCDSSMRFPSAESASLQRPSGEKEKHSQPALTKRAVLRASRWSSRIKPSHLMRNPLLMISWQISSRCPEGMFTTASVKWKLSMPYSLCKCSSSSTTDLGGLQRSFLPWSFGYTQYVHLKGHPRFVSMPTAGTYELSEL